MNEHEFSTILQQARHHFKGGLKSSNKKYQTEDTDKKIRRNTAILGTEPTPPWLREIEPVASQIAALRSNMRFKGITTMEQRGEYILGNSIKFGNCGEMCAVAVRLCRLRFGHGLKIFSALLNKPGDHIFLLISLDGTRPPTRAFNIYQLSRENRQNFWIIDCWSNISCFAHQYQDEIRKRFAQWSREGKFIVDNNTAEMLDPCNKRLLNRFFGSEISWRQC